MSRMYRYWRTIIIYISYFHNRVKWNHFIMTSVDSITINIHTYKCIYVMIKCVCVVSSRRNKTNPHHGINTFLFFKQLVYKHSSPNKHQLINHKESINKMCYRSYSCICWNIFNRIHFIAICDVLLHAIWKFVCHANKHICWSWKLTKQLRTTFILTHTYNMFTLLYTASIQQC